MFRQTRLKVTFKHSFGIQIYNPTPYYCPKGLSVVSTSLAILRNPNTLMQFWVRSNGSLLVTSRPTPTEPELAKLEMLKPRSNVVS